MNLNNGLFNDSLARTICKTLKEGLKKNSHDVHL
jgi:hypothetical protein